MKKVHLALVEKLHKQFAHPTSQRLKSLMKDAGIDEISTLDLVGDVSDQCEICTHYKKTPARPVVSLPMATKVNDVVAMDLKIGGRVSTCFT